MKIPLGLKASFVAAGVSLLTLSVTFAVAGLMQQRYTTIAAQPPSKIDIAPQESGNVGLVDRGHRLFLMNCAHCHADDATGDEGPDLHGLRKSDGRIAAIIQNGIKGEMPRFNQKLNDADVQALIAFLHSLKS
jgi:mono/diheme cytochrome c family protein